MRLRQTVRVIEIHVVCVGVVVTEIVIPTDVARLLRPDLFLFKREKHRVLDHFAAGGIDRVRDVGVKFDSLRSGIAVSRMLKSMATLVTEVRPGVILDAAFGAMDHQFPAWHRHERPVDAINDFQVPNHETMIECQRTKRLEAFRRIVQQFDSHVGDLHHHISQCFRGTPRRQIPAVECVPVMLLRFVRKCLVTVHVFSKLTETKGKNL